ncbi:MAG: hypothetical protein B7Z73_04555 [Planctomycetia bacterium 21-64-5]|nr:MAG: hypothetical protein B7Z73_04555 [Planctomycetia bacterium 21-64-5]HQU43056.1 hypothetical protein [Pirellulales bacterium]
MRTRFFQVRLARVFVGSWCVLAMWPMFPATAAADSGTIRASQRQGDLQITVFSGPTPLRAGQVDFSVLVQDIGTAEVVFPEIDIALSQRDEDSIVHLHRHATPADASNKLFQAANLELPHAGWWAVHVGIDGPNGNLSIAFDFEAEERSPTWRSLWLWFCWPFFTVALFVAFDASRRKSAIKVR